MTDDLTEEIAVVLLSKVVGVGYQARGYMNVGDAYALAEAAVAVANAHNTVETVADLVALPVETALIDSLGNVYEKWPDGDADWQAPGDETSYTHNAIALPATILYRPTTSGDADV